MHARLEQPVERMPFLARPLDWRPRVDERVRFYQGDGYPVIAVRIAILDIEPGRHLVSSHYLRGTVPDERIYPFPNWRAIREMEDRDRSPLPEAIEF